MSASKVVVKPDVLREMLRRNARKRESLRQQKAELREETEKLLAQTRGVISIKEAAELMEMNRSTLYELYLDEGNGDGSARTTAA